MGTEAMAETILLIVSSLIPMSFSFTIQLR